MVRGSADDRQENEVGYAFRFGGIYQCLLSGNIDAF
jgi:hypothetical protein